MDDRITCIMKRPWLGVTSFICLPNPGLTAIVRDQSRRAYPIPLEKLTDDDRDVRTMAEQLRNMSASAPPLHTFPSFSFSGSLTNARKTQ